MSKTVSIIPSRGANYAPWKVQCRMALGLQNIVNGTETMPEGGGAGRRANFKGRRDRVLALIVLSIKLSLLYLIMNRKIQLQSKEYFLQ